MLSMTGFPQPVSIDSFRRPNFNLMASILHYLIGAIAPEAGLALDIGTPEDRLYFVTTAASIIQNKAHVRLNTKRLYEADTSAARELRKVCAEVCMFLSSRGAADTYAGSAYMDLSMHATTLRQTASEFVERSTALLLLLKNNADDVMDAINRAVTTQPDPTSLSHAVQRRLETLRQECRRVEESVETNKHEKKKLEEQLEQKTEGIKRTMDRLDSIRATKPSFLADLEALEAELTKMYIEYSKKFRSLTFFESQLRANDIREQQKLRERENNLRDLQRAAMQEELDVLYGGVDDQQSTTGGEDPFMETPMPLVSNLDGSNKSARPTRVPPRSVPINVTTDIPGEDSYSYEYDEEESDGPSLEGAAPPRPRAPTGSRPDGSKTRVEQPEVLETEDDDEEYYEYSDVDGEELDPDKIDF